MSIGKHYETGESIPDDIYKKLLAARTFRAGSLSLRQVADLSETIIHLFDRVYIFHIIKSMLLHDYC